MTNGWSVRDDLRAGTKQTLRQVEWRCGRRGIHCCCALLSFPFDCQQVHFHAFYGLSRTITEPPTPNSRQWRLPFTSSPALRTRFLPWSWASRRLRCGSTARRRTRADRRRRQLRRPAGMSAVLPSQLPGGIFDSDCSSQTPWLPKELVDWFYAAARHHLYPCPLTSSRKTLESTRTPSLLA